VLVVEEYEADELRIPDELLYGSAETLRVTLEEVTSCLGSPRSQAAESVVSAVSTTPMTVTIGRATESHISAAFLIFTLLPHSPFQAS